MFLEYMQVVADDLADTSAECVNNVKEAVNQVESLLNNPSSISVTRIFNLCDSIEDDLDNTWDVANFFESITIPFAAIAQYNNIPGTKTNLDDLCNIMNDKTIGTEIYRLAEVNRLYSGTRCLNYSYDYVVQYLKDPSKITSGGKHFTIYCLIN
ncbi:hypothetical protein NQ314_005663 [Rhamnusium bicolor]|uniref:Uncharacterized protein n=1 Tax=Rhamnusium bicolor TaxID=1586634 RepID=A0AAV8ZHV1_9CUCU|nr:hypothetical protein NQ314_005663 [Rhamnusium bicolor]